MSPMHISAHGPYLVQESLCCKRWYIAYPSISGLYHSVMVIIGQACSKGKSTKVFVCIRQDIRGTWWKFGGSLSLISFNEVEMWIYLFIFI